MHGIHHHLSFSLPPLPCFPLVAVREDLPDRLPVFPLSRRAGGPVQPSPVFPLSGRHVGAITSGSPSAVIRAGDLPYMYAIADGTVADAVGLCFGL